MKFCHAQSQKEGAEVLAKKIESYLRQGQKVLWLLSGGSNLSISVEALKILKESCNTVFFLPPLVPHDGMETKPSLKSNLAVMLTDERYGLVGHPDSNWQQLVDAGFDVEAVQTRPVLENLPLAETVEKFTHDFQELSVWADVRIAQFGIGPDGHVAGVLPQSKGVTADEVACVGEIYPHNQSRNPAHFTRISLTLSTIKNISIAYTFAFGQAKKAVIESLKNDDLPLATMPAQILKEIKESYLYSDMI